MEVYHRSLECRCFARGLQVTVCATTRSRSSLHTSVARDELETHYLYLTVMFGFYFPYVHLMPLLVIVPRLRTMAVCDECRRTDGTAPTALAHVVLDPCLDLACCSVIDVTRTACLIERARCLHSRGDERSVESRL